jgi:hypothetical protein
MIPPQLVTALKVALIDQLARPVIDAGVDASRKPLAKWMRKRADKLRRKQDEKNGIDTTGRS